MIGITGFTGFIGFVGFVGFIGFVGFLALRVEEPSHGVSFFSGEGLGGCVFWVGLWALLGLGFCWCFCWVRS